MSLISAHWFDFVAVVVLVAGFKIGQRKEALPQLLSFSHWAITLLICSFLYKAPAIWLARKFSMQPDVMALILFPIEFLLVYYVLGFQRRRIADKISEKEPFGHWEHRVTKAAGSLRFLIFMLVVMAWISGRYVTAKDIRDHEIFCEENFGGITYPVLCTVHNDMFNGSYTGKFAKKYLSGILMTAIPRVDYGEEPSIPVQTTNRKVQLRELNNEFEKEDPQNLNAGAVKEVVTSEKPSTGSVSNRSIYRDITLKGISGSGDRLFALINDLTLREGDSDFIRIENRKIPIHCVRVQESSALIRLEGEPNPIELKLGIATNLKGEPVVKK